ncbi:LacI family DNA-binding transcriptional regulator [Glycomyces sp. NPDC021274]|uniref:LacI family DNA-binding transcriptional regulator n=1 Tax=Glycomyces sp. NPDC021274 TaxID=3155120 RepID=UPI0033F40F0B
MKRGKVTMSDVARLAGVSPMTVSNVVNKRVNVSDEAKARVLEAIRASGYQINLSARALRSGRSRVIGFAVPQLDNPYYGMLAGLLSEQAHERGYRIAVEQTRGIAEGEATAIAQSQVLHLDGLIMAAVEFDPLVPPIPSQGYPIVLLGEQDLGGRYDHIMMPNEAGTAAATEHLIDQGCRRIAVVTDAEFNRLTMITRRYNGYRNALEDRGLQVDPDLRLILEAFSRESARSTGRRIAESDLGIDAVVAFTDTVAMGIMRGLLDRGVRVPDDMRVIGFDDIPESPVLTPSLSTVSPDHRWTAAKALDLIISRIDELEIPPRQHTAPFEVVARESTA